MGPSDYHPSSVNNTFYVKFGKSLRSLDMNYQSKLGPGQYIKSSPKVNNSGKTIGQKLESKKPPI